MTKVNGGISPSMETKTQPAQTLAVPPASTIIIQPPSPADWFALLPVVVGGLLAILAGMVGNAVPQCIQRRHERKNLASAFLGEITALLKVVETRRYQEGLEQVLQQVEANKQVMAYTFSVRLNPFTVYTANISRIGILPNPLPNMICQLYSQAEAILEDIADMRDPNFCANLTVTDCINRLKELRDLFQNTVQVGRETVAELKQMLG